VGGKSLDARRIIQEEEKMKKNSNGKEYDNLVIGVAVLNALLYYMGNIDLLYISTIPSIYFALEYGRAEGMTVLKKKRKK